MSFDQVMWCCAGLGEYLYSSCMLASCWLSTPGERETETESVSALMVVHSSLCLHWCNMMWWKCMCANWNSLWQTDRNIKSVRKKVWFYFLFIYSFISFFVTPLPNRAPPVPPLHFHYLPFHTVWISHRAGKRTSKHPQLHLPSLTLPSTCVLIPLCIFTLFGQN